jgi:putative ABC transport system ATP-binding protein
MSPPSETPPIRGGFPSPIVELEDVQKVYQMGRVAVPALRDVSIALAPGSFWAIMGPSGSGKSTLLNILGCLDRPTRGHYLLQGDDVGTLDDDTLSELRLRRLGFVFQSFNLIPQLTVEENIQLPLYYLGWDPDRSVERARELAGKLDLAGRLHHRPTELSGGQQQRVAIARALANDPSIILADEPTGNVDSAMGSEIMEIIGELNSSGKTIIMVTHEPYIADYARSRLYMKDGAVERTEGEG